MMTAKPISNQQRLRWEICIITTFDHIVFICCACTKEYSPVFIVSIYKFIHIASHLKYRSEYLWLYGFPQWGLETKIPYSARTNLLVIGAATVLNACRFFMLIIKHVTNIDLFA
jgi:hypothetical protein